MRAMRAVLAAGLLVASQLASACDFEPLRIAVNVGKVGGVTVNLGESDNSQHPTAWQGPLTLSTGSAPACTVSDEVSIIVRPVVFADGILYVPTYSGSSSIVYAVDVKSCKVIWRSDDFPEKTRFEKGRLIMGTSQLRVDRRCDDENEIPPQRAVTDEKGAFRFPAIERSAGVRRMIPSQPMMLQKIVIHYQGVEYIAWRHGKDSYDANMELDGRQLKLVCELSRQPDFEGTHYGLCKAD